MLSYRHGFHAGNPADVLKHWVLSLVLEALQKKEKPFFVLETHAGAGRYELCSDFAQKNREYAAGIGRLLGHKSIPSEFDVYLQGVRSLNPSGTLKIYPGSPLLIQRGTRANDRIVLAELHSSEVVSLERCVGRDERIRVESQDGYGLMKSLLPPPERRGLIHIDPSYERSDERERLVKGLTAGIKRFETGVYAIWYPVMRRWSSQRFIQDLGSITSRPKYLAEMITDPLSENGMQGSGVLIINPPWQLDQAIESGLPWLLSVLSKDEAGSFRAEWLQ